MLIGWGVVSRLVSFQVETMIPKLTQIEWIRQTLDWSHGRGRIVSSSHGIQLDGSRFWVTHRRKTYGPFDYEWNTDFCGMELLYNGHKFGEYCSVDELYADLKPFKLPMTVVSVTSIVMGCVLFGIMHGLRENERCDLLLSRLSEHGFNRFVLERWNARQDDVP